MTYSIIEKWSLAIERSKLRLSPFSDKVQLVSMWLLKLREDLVKEQKNDMWIQFAIHFLLHV